MKTDIKKAAILHPGAIGDCVLLLPLAKFLKETLDCGLIELIAHADYVRFYPGRTCIDQVRSIESLPLHRLFATSDEFTVAEKDPLIEAFAGHEYVVSFLGVENEHFEQNLLFAIHCSHSGEATMMPLAGPANEHTSLFYVREFIRQNHLETPEQIDLTNVWIDAMPQDMVMGADILSQCGIGEQHAVCLIHPGGGAIAKCRPIDDFVAIAEIVRGQSLKPVFLLGPAEMERLSTQDKDRLKNAAPLLSGLSLENVLGVLSCTDCFLGNDSGISHLAGAMGKKTIALFGPTNPAQYSPLGPTVYVIQTANTDFANPSPDARKWVQQCVKDILSGTATQKHLTQTDKTL
jgi:ADP-heptose:LPS heptosyltransferase